MPTTPSENVIPLRPGLVSMHQRGVEDEAYYQGLVRLLLAVRTGEIRGEGMQARSVRPLRRRARRVNLSGEANEPPEERSCPDGPRS